MRDTGARDVARLQPPAVDEHLRVGVILRQMAEASASIEIRARVADMDDQEVLGGFGRP